MIDSANDPGRYDQEVFLALREWEYFLSTMDQDEMGPDPSDPMPEKPAAPDRRPNGLEVSAPLYSMNDKMLGAGEPLRVKQGQRVLIHLLNASAAQIHRLALPGHKFQVIALDGNPVPTPQSVDVIEIAPGERVDAIVEMNHPGVWILGEAARYRAAIRHGHRGGIRQSDTSARSGPRLRKSRWDYAIFGTSTPHPAPDQTIDMVFEKVPGGPNGINHWLVNGKEYPHEREFVFRQGGRYRLVFHNRSDDSHPLHMHRHLFELVELNGKPTAGIKKDTVIVPAFGRADGGSGCRPAWPDAVSLPYPAAHGLWFHGAVSLRLSHGARRASGRLAPIPANALRCRSTASFIYRISSTTVVSLRASARHVTGRLNGYTPQLE